VTPILYQHDDGRYALAGSEELATFTVGDPAWHRVPLDVVALTGSKSATGARPRDPVATSDAERAAYPALPEGWTTTMTPDPEGTPFTWFDEAQMRAYVDADRKERQLSACNFCLSEAAKARAALPIDFKQATDQGGWQLVPKEPTPGMCDAGVEGRMQYLLNLNPGYVSEPQDEEAASYRAMLAAAPTLLGVADGDAVGGKSGGQQ
jgi:hypothetical protein